MEGFHGGLGEDFDAGGIAVADALELGGSADADRELLVGIGYEIAVCIEDVDGDEGHVFAIGLEGLDGCAEVACQLNLRGSTGGLHGLGAYFFAVLVIHHHLQFARFVLHVVPAQAVAVDGRVVDVGNFALLACTALHVGSLGDAALRLSVHEEFGSGVVGVAIDGGHLAFASRPCPVGQEVDGLVGGVPVRAIEVVAVFGQSGEVEDAEVGRAAGPIAVVGSGFAEIVEACPDKLANHPRFVILQEPVLLGDVGPPAGFGVVTGALAVIVGFAVETANGELIHAARGNGRGRLAAQHVALAESCQCLFI